MLLCFLTSNWNQAFTLVRKKLLTRAYTFYTIAFMYLDNQNSVPSDEIEITEETDDSNSALKHDQDSTDTSGSGCDEGRLVDIPSIDTDLYSRQLLVYGR